LARWRLTLEASAETLERVGFELGGVVVLGPVAGVSEVEGVGVAPAGQSRIGELTVDGVSDQDEGVLDGRSLRLVDRGGVPVGEVPSPGVVGWEFDRVPRTTGTRPSGITAILGVGLMVVGFVTGAMLIIDGTRQYLLGLPGVAVCAYVATNGSNSSPVCKYRSEPLTQRSSSGGGSPSACCLQVVVIAIRGCFRWPRRSSQRRSVEREYPSPSNAAPKRKHEQCNQDRAQDADGIREHVSRLSQGVLLWRFTQNRN
jgi:hypothetical protein